MFEAKGEDTSVVKTYFIRGEQGYSQELYDIYQQRQSALVVSYPSLLLPEGWEKDKDIRRLLKEGRRQLLITFLAAKLAEFTSLCQEQVEVALAQILDDTIFRLLGRVVSERRSPEHQTIIEAYIHDRIARIVANMAANADSFFETIKTLEQIRAIQERGRLRGWLSA